MYHFTSIENLIEIISSNEMIGDGSISFTRDKNFLDTTGGDSLSGETECRIVIDGGKLSNRYKIRPYNYFPNMSTRPNRETSLAINGEDFVAGPESEEIALTDKIENIKDYIIRFDFIFGTKNKWFTTKPTENELNVLKRNGIEFKNNRNKLTPEFLINVNKKEND